MKILEQTVYPSNHPTVAVVNDTDVYGGAHHYVFENCTGFANGETQYGGGTQTLQFVHKSDDGTITAGVQFEQILIALIDRIKKVNSRFPASENATILQGLEMALEAQTNRVKDRISRNVMGDLKK